MCPRQNLCGGRKSLTKCTTCRKKGLRDDFNLYALVLTAFDQGKHHSDLSQQVHLYKKIYCCYIVCSDVTLVYNFITEELCLNGKLLIQLSLVNQCNWNIQWGMEHYSVCEIISYAIFHQTDVLTLV